MEDIDSTIKAYVIKCADDCYYIGTTDSLVNTWFHHINGLETEWTCLHAPLRIISVINDAETYDEFSLIKYYMAKYGIHKVRGGNYKDIFLSQLQLTQLEHALKEEKDSTMNELADMCDDLELK